MVKDNNISAQNSVGVPACTTAGQKAAHGVPIVLVHGFMQSPATWDAVVSSLRCVSSVAVPALAPDNPHDATLAALAQQVVNTLEHACAEADTQQAVLVGYSLGGRVALEVACSRPELLAALVLESAGLGPEDEGDRETLTLRNRALAESLQTQGLEAFVDTWEDLDLFATQRTLPAEVQKSVRANRLACNPVSLTLLLEHAGAHAMPLARQTRCMLAQLTYPVIYAAGERDTKYRALAQTLPSNVDVRLFDAGHNVHLERPHAYVQMLAHLLESFE